MIIAVIGLGYVGLPLAAAINKKHEVIGFDVNSERIAELKVQFDRNGELGKDDIIHITFTDDKNLFYMNPDVYIVCVPTPVNKNNKPDLSCLISACDSIAPSLKAGALIINESTVYPGVTESILKEWLEFKSELRFGLDFQLGYSPERINPGDKINQITNVTKIIAASNDEALSKMKDVYSFTGTFVAESIKVAEASKVLENTQRDVNIALMNEMAILFDKTSISTKAVLDCCKTKWNFLDFKPGLVGGHCISVDPLYISYFAEKNNWNLDLVNTARFINDNYLVTLITSVVVDKGYKSVGILGVTFKKNVPDVRNSLIFKLAKNIRQHNINVFLTDPLAIDKDVDENEGEYLLNLDTVRNLSNVLIKAVDHDSYKDFSTYKDIMDLTQTLDPSDCVWSL